MGTSLPQPPLLRASAPFTFFSLRRPLVLRPLLPRVVASTGRFLSRPLSSREPSRAVTLKINVGTHLQALAYALREASYVQAPCDLAAQSVLWRYPPYGNVLYA